MTILNKTQETYQKNLESDPIAHKHLKLMDVTSGEFALKIGLGWAGTVPIGKRKKGKLYNSITFPLFKDNKICGFLGWESKISKKKFMGDDISGIINYESLLNHNELIITDSPSRYVSLRQFGFDNVICLSFKEHSDYLISALNSNGIQKVYLTSKKYVKSLKDALAGTHSEILQLSFQEVGEFNREKVINAIRKAKKVKEAKPFKIKKKVGHL